MSTKRNVAAGQNVMLLCALRSTYRTSSRLLAASTNARCGTTAAAADGLSGYTTVVKSSRPAHTWALGVLHCEADLSALHCRVRLGT
jgi:hypothetical protein